MSWVYCDGGRRAAGFRGDADDCVARAVAIISGRPYREVYDDLAACTKAERFRRGRVGRAAATGRGSSPRTGMLKETYKDYLRQTGWTWTPTMQIGQGCRVHLRADELPPGRLLVACSKHLTVVIDGVIHDTHDPSRGGTRCVYGFWTQGDV